ncbi:putative aldouronate transport system substrate-binding protein [Arthrobacter stackebrandtii]|uniref:Aldouronate transport system substrate-binding protein n=1 Tax=Arthrobacter stackebrandtii TaxID=272161 RepID=A0ABS4YRK0_9MICC|nr:substrate-binding domain-containing protein [Arthrobacter stackebrandtii]MBP2411416.1 putative aldouronate transport system substrate-binding protein [Arthrobacter stackebrandtii]PYH00298.1 sugar ABC transporter substrate-binding protein [Arthrobacter stackebrandtii]
MKRAVNGAGVSRRNFLGLAGASVAAIALTGTLSACSGGSDSKGGGGAAASKAVVLPTYKEFTGVTADLPGNAEGLEPGFLNMPTPVASTKAKPLTGPISVLSETFEVMAPAMPDNPFWQRLNTALGGEFNMQIVEDIGDGYPAKFATILAGGDLPDLMWIPPNQGIPNVGPMLEAKFQDLTPYLSGDAVLDYPNLAALKPDSWRTAVVNGKIWGAPIPSTPFGQVMIGTAGTWEKVGGLNAKDADEFFEKAKELTNPSKKQYALEPAYINVLHMITEWLGAPNAWAVNKDRSLTHLYETDQYTAGVEYAAKLFAAGAFYPDVNVTNTKSLILNGTLGAVVTAGPRDIRGYSAIDKDAKMEILVPFSFDGKITPTYDMGYGTVGYTAFKKTDEKRIKEQLELINWLSAPFGTVEYLQKNFGWEGDDFTFDGDGNPILTEAGQKNLPGVVSALNIMSSPESVVFSPGFPEVTKYIHETEKKLLENAWRNPTNGSYSDTNAKVGPKITKIVRDKTIDIITGRAKITELADVVKRWKSEGGDKIRAEYEADLNPDAPVFTLQPVSKS